MSSDKVAPNKELNLKDEIKELIQGDKELLAKAEAISMKIFHMTGTEKVFFSFFEMLWVEFESHQVQSAEVKETSKKMVNEFKKICDKVAPNKEHPIPECFVFRPLLNFQFKIQNKSYSIQMELFTDNNNPLSKAPALKFFNFYRTNPNGITVDCIYQNYLIGIGTKNFNPVVASEGKASTIGIKNFPPQLHDKGGIVSLVTNPNPQNSFSYYTGFIITLAPCPWLDKKYIVIGQVKDFRYDPTDVQEENNKKLKQVVEEFGGGSNDDIKKSFEKERLASIESFKGLHEIEKWATPSGDPAINITAQRIDASSFLTSSNTGKDSAQPYQRSSQKNSSTQSMAAFPRYNLNKDV